MADTTIFPIGESIPPSTARSSDPSYEKPVLVQKSLLFFAINRSLIFPSSQ